jgi:iron complex transport system substrate-binding protein
MIARVAATIAAFAALPVFADSYPEAARIVSIGGSVTEIVYALGQEKRLVARDSTSTWPAEAQSLPDVGYVRALGAEGVLSVDPDLILAIDGSGPPEAVDLLKSASIPYVTIPEGNTGDAIIAKVEAVAEALGVPEKGEKLAEQIRADLASATWDETGERKRVLFVLSMQGGRIMAAGRDTSAEGIIELAGGENAIADFDGYKQITDEAVTNAAPDVILMLSREGDHGGADDQVFGHPAISVTPAAEARAIVRMDGLLLLGFGPRTPDAVRELHAALYGDG